MHLPQESVHSVEHWEVFCLLRGEKHQQQLLQQLWWPRYGAQPTGSECS